ncbi:MAG: thioredoxin family protein, partial [Planctomycetota bacterium]
SWGDSSQADPAAEDAESGASNAEGDALTPDLFGLELPDPRTPIGLIVIFLAAAAGGLILNMTPCVLPVIPIKVMTISQHAGTPGRSLLLGLWMALGVVAFWAAIGVPVAALTSVTDPSRIFGFWWVTLGIGVLIAVMGVGIMGAFNITLPEKVYAVNPKADTPWGSFVFGIMTAVLGLPCFGFVAGGLLAGSATLPPVVIMAIFVGLGVGMASPYLVLSAKPGLVNKIPRTGPASELVKQVMGLLLIAAAAYFAGSGLISLVNEKPWLGKQLHWWVVAIFVALAGGWLIWQTLKITKKPVARVVFVLLGLLLAISGAAIAESFTAKAREIYQERQAALELAAEQGADGGLITTTWIDWTPALFERARAEGYTVVLDFTAEWCINCKVLKAQVLNVEPVKSVLAGERVVAMTVDLTSNSAPGWGKLAEIGRTGIPTLAIFGPGTDEPWISGAYTPGQVVGAIERAGGS